MPLYDRMPAHRADSIPAGLLGTETTGKIGVAAGRNVPPANGQPLFGRQAQEESKSIRQWEMIRLSPPDSTGRQHVSAVVRSRDTRSSRSFSEDSLRRNVTGTVRQKEDNRSRDKAEKQQTPTALWKWAAGVIAVVGGIAGLRRIGRH